MDILCSLILIYSPQKPLVSSVRKELMPSVQIQIILYLALFLQSVVLWIWEHTSLVWSQAWPVFLQRIDDSHYDRIHYSLSIVYCFDNGYVGKQPVAWKEYCTENWIKELKEIMDRCTGCCNVTEILLKMVLNTNHSINSQSHRVIKIRNTW